jgi:hypothetical protein
MSGAYEQSAAKLANATSGTPPANHGQATSALLERVRSVRNTSNFSPSRNFVHACARIRKLRRSRGRVSRSDRTTALDFRR